MVVCGNQFAICIDQLHPKLVQVVVAVVVVVVIVVVVATVVVLSLLEEEFFLDYSIIQNTAKSIPLA